MDLPRLPLPEYMSIDEVYLNISNSQKYAFVIMDFSNGEIVDIVHNRWSSTLEDYFLHIPLQERLKVKAVICDAYQTYLTMPEKYFPNSCTVLDSFHAVKTIISYLNGYINKVMKKYQDRDKKALEEKITTPIVTIRLLKNLKRSFCSKTIAG
ncbi:MAG: transposase [Holdemanella porci]